MSCREHDECNCTDCAECKHQCVIRSMKSDAAFLRTLGGSLTENSQPENEEENAALAEVVVRLDGIAEEIESFAVGMETEQPLGLVQ